MASNSVRARHRRQPATTTSLGRYDVAVTDAARGDEPGDPIGSGEAARLYEELVASRRLTDAAVAELLQARFDFAALQDQHAALRAELESTRAALSASRAASANVGRLRSALTDLVSTAERLHHRTLLG